MGDHLLLLSRPFLSRGAFRAGELWLGSIGWLIYSASLQAALLQQPSGRGRRLSIPRSRSWLLERSEWGSRCVEAPRPQAWPLGRAIACACGPGAGGGGAARLRRARARPGGGARGAPPRRSARAAAAACKQPLPADPQLPLAPPSSATLPLPLLVAHALRSEHASVASPALSFLLPAGPATSHPQLLLYLSIQALGFQHRSVGAAHVPVGMPWRRLASAGGSRRRASLARPAQRLPCTLARSATVPLWPILVVHCMPLTHCCPCRSCQEASRQWRAAGALDSGAAPEARAAGQLAAASAAWAGFPR